MRSSTVMGWSSIFMVILAMIVYLTPFRINFPKNLTEAFLVFIIGIFFNMKAENLRFLEDQNAKRIEELKKEVSK